MQVYRDDVVWDSQYVDWVRNTNPRKSIETKISLLDYASLKRHLYSTRHIKYMQSVSLLLRNLY